MASVELQEIEYQKREIAELKKKIKFLHHQKDLYENKMRIQILDLKGIKKRIDLIQKHIYIQRNVPENIKDFRLYADLKLLKKRLQYLYSNIFIPESLEEFKTKCSFFPRGKSKYGKAKS